MTERGSERRESIQREERTIITDGPVVIISPSLGFRTRVAPSEGGIVTRVERLTDGEEKRFETQAQFTAITRHLIWSMINAEAAKIRAGSETIPPELDVDAYERQFRGAVRSFADIGVSTLDVEKMIDEEGKQITIGQTHIGEIPPIVREQMVKMKSVVKEVYQAKARAATARPGRSR